jgi:hypothetical protein
MRRQSEFVGPKDGCTSSELSRSMLKDGHQTAFGVHASACPSQWGRDESSEKREFVHLTPEQPMRPLTHPSPPVGERVLCRVAATSNQSCFIA